MCISILSFRNIAEVLPIKTYLITSGTVFGLIALAHIARMFAEGMRLVTEPLFVVLTFVAAALSSWAWYLLWRSFRKQKE
jgi:heme/copper-type cytochrome/quinol oxidase subunit 1